MKHCYFDSRVPQTLKLCSFQVSLVSSQMEQSTQYTFKSHIYVFGISFSLKQFPVQDIQISWSLAALGEIVPPAHC